MEPFEQLPEESAQAFKAFSLYLNLGRDRTTGAVAKRLDRCVRSIQRLSRKYHWIERTAAYDRQLAKIEYEAQGDLLRQKAVGWGERQQELREEEWQIHEECIRAGRLALSRFCQKGSATTLGDIARIFETASRLGRLAAEMPTDVTEFTGAVAGSVNVEFEAALKKVYGEPIPPETVLPPAPIPEEHEPLSVLSAPSNRPDSGS